MIEQQKIIMCSYCSPFIVFTFPRRSFSRSLAFDKLQPKCSTACVVVVVDVVAVVAVELLVCAACDEVAAEAVDEVDPGDVVVVVVTAAVGAAVLGRGSFRVGSL
jgi:hypothetical protein